MNFTITNQPLIIVLSWLLLAFLPVGSATAGRPEALSFKMTNWANSHTFGDKDNDGAEVPLSTFRIEIEFDEAFRSSVTDGAMVTNLNDIVAMFELWKGGFNHFKKDNLDMSSADISHIGKTLVVFVKLKQGLKPNTEYTLELKWGGVKGWGVTSWYWSNYASEIDFKTTHEVSIIEGKTTTLCPNGDETTISPILIAERSQYSFVPDQSHTLTLELSDPDFEITNTTSNEIKAEMYGLGAVQPLTVNLVANEINIDISVGNSDATSGTIMLSGIRVRYKGTTDKNCILRAKQKTAHLISGLYIEGAARALANLEGKTVINDATLNLGTVDIVGPTAICVGSLDAQNYFVSPVSGATQYIWNIPPVFKNPTESFVVNLGGGRWQTPNNAISLYLKEGTPLASGLISVQAVMQCKQGTPSKDFTVTINQPVGLTFNYPTEVLSNEHPLVLSANSSSVGTTRFSGNGIVKNTFVPSLITGPYPRNVEIDYSFTSGTTGCVSKGKFTIKVLDGRVPKNMKMWVSRDLDNPFVHFKTNVPSATPAWHWQWAFDNSRSNLPNPTLVLQQPLPQSIAYNLAIKDEKDRQYSLDKSFQIDIAFSGQQLGTSTKFEKTVDLGASNGKINSHLWDFGDGTTSTENNPQHTYATSGKYKVKLTIVAEDFITYEITKRVDIFSIVPVKRTQLYAENFDNVSDYWATAGTVDSAGVLVQRGSWQLKTPAGFGHIPDNKGAAWITDNQDLPFPTSSEARYYTSEQSYVESPSFDITDLKRPTVSFDYWVDTEAGADGVVLLYTVDDGKTWWRVGKINQGLAWYNTRPILGSPGKYFTIDNVDNQGWSGSQQYEQNQGWKTATFALDNALEKMLKFSDKVIRFRVVFGSNADDSPNKKFDGFAFDNFQINNRNRLVLMEYFTNQTIANAASKDQQIKKFVDTKNEIINLHYHVDFPGRDQANELNHKDPSGRAFHYGIRQAPQTVINGSTQESVEFDQDWAENIFFHHTLIMAPFEIAINQAIHKNGKVGFSATITALQQFDKKIIMHAVVVDTAVNMGGELYHQVVRKMLPDASGTYLAKTWIPGSTHTLNFSWNTGNLPIERLKVIVFVENYETREVYQAAVNKVEVSREQTNNDTDTVTGTNWVDVGQARLVAYPNPTAHTIRLSLGKSAVLPAHSRWVVTNTEGQAMAKGSLASPRQHLEVNVHHLPKGVYLIKLWKGAWTVQQKFYKL